MRAAPAVSGAKIQVIGMITFYGEGQNPACNFTCVLARRLRTNAAGSAATHCFRRYATPGSIISQPLRYFPMPTATLVLTIAPDRDGKTTLWVSLRNTNGT